MRNEFASTVKEELTNNNRSILLLGDIGVGSFLDKAGQLPANVLNMGIAEQGMICFAAGLAAPGANVIVHTISPFLVERAYEQIKLCCGYNKKRLILVSANGPFDYYKLGPTHHCAADVALLSQVDNIELYLPATKEDVRDVFECAFKSSKSSYIRLTSRVADARDYVKLDETWKRISSKPPGEGCVGIENPKYTIVCVGESLKYVISKIPHTVPHEVLWTTNPTAEIPIKHVRGGEVIIYEPYTETSGTLSIFDKSVNVRRMNFSKAYKRVITEEMGWEDFFGGL